METKHRSGRAPQSSSAFPFLETTGKGQQGHTYKFIVAEKVDYNDGGLCFQLLFLPINNELVKQKQFIPHRAQCFLQHLQMETEGPSVPQSVEINHLQESEELWADFISHTATCSWWLAGGDVALNMSVRAH